MQTLHDIGMDGQAALEHVLAQTDYGSVEQAAASLSIFSHPDTVAQTSGQALFPIIRDAKRRGETAEIDGRMIGYDDNKAPTDAFLWANEISKRPPEFQFNHVYARSDDPDCYTSLANMCASPAFLAKLTDTNDRVKTLFKYRVFDLYGWRPPDTEPPSEPEGYSDIVWSPPLPPVDSVKEAIGRQLQRRQDRTTRMVESTGWLFG